MVCTSLGSLLHPLFYFLCYIPGTKKDAGTAIRAQKLSPGRNLGKKKLTTPITGGSQVVHSPILGQKMLTTPISVGSQVVHSPILGPKKS